MAPELFLLGDSTLVYPFRLDCYSVGVTALHLYVLTSDLHNRLYADLDLTVYHEI